MIEKLNLVTQKWSCL